MRVGIVGAGVAGLAAARELRSRGHEPVVYDSHDRSGGRLSTFRSGGFCFDMGPSVLAPRGKPLERVLLSELHDPDLEPIRLGVAHHEGSRPSPDAIDKKPVERFAYRHGNDRLADLLAKDLDLRLGTTVLELDRRGETYGVADDEFDALIVCTPSPEAARLLATLGEKRSLGNSVYRACLSVAFGFDKELQPKPYFALMDPAQRYPLTWVSFESLKCPNRAPDGCSAVVVQLSAEYSLAHFALPEDGIVGAVLGLLERLLGPGFGSPILSKVCRWPYSHPENISLFETVNHHGSKLLVAGDGLAGPRVEYAYDSGVRAARMLLEEP